MLCFCFFIHEGITEQEIQITKSSIKLLFKFLLKAVPFETMRDADSTGYARILRLFIFFKSH